MLRYFTKESRCTRISSRVGRNITCAAGVGQNRTRSRCRAWGGGGVQDGGGRARGAPWTALRAGDPGPAPEQPA